MTTDDPTSDLTRVLYEALKDEEPRIAPLFGHDTDILRPVLSTVLAEAASQQWIQNQLNETGIRSMDFRNGIHMELEPARELLATWVAAARTMLGDAPNYTETKISMDVKVAESPEMYTLVVQRHTLGALTPHEARQKAEARVAELETTTTNARKLISGWLKASADHHAVSHLDALKADPLMAGMQNGRANQYSDCANELQDVLNGEDPDGWEHNVGIAITPATEEPTP